MDPLSGYLDACYRIEIGVLSPISFVSPSVMQQINEILPYAENFSGSEFGLYQGIEGSRRDSY
jgi:hypothetical protein